jgi:exodeoxyribonuclease VII large subunit
MATPDCVELRQQLVQWQRRLGRVTQRTLEGRMQRLDYLGKRLVHPRQQIRDRMAALRHLATRMRGAWQRSLQAHAWRERDLARRVRVARPDPEVLERENRERARRLQRAAIRRLEAAAGLLNRTEAHLKHLSPQLVLERGYSITATGAGRIVRDSAQVACGEELKITFARGWVGAHVKQKAGTGSS